jgi:hypothetical protein
LGAVLQSRPSGRGPRNSASCRDRAIIVIAGDYSDDTRDRSTFDNDTTHMQSTGQILDLFSGHVGKVYFRHEPELPDYKMVMTVFELNKP